MAIYNIGVGYVKFCPESLKNFSVQWNREYIYSRKVWEFRKWTVCKCPCKLFEISLIKLDPTRTILTQFGQFINECDFDYVWKVHVTFFFIPGYDCTCNQKLSNEIVNDFTCFMLSLIWLKTISWFLDSVWQNWSNKKSIRQLRFIV